VDDPSGSDKRVEPASDTPANSAEDEVMWSGVRIVVPGKPDVLIQLKGVPALFAEAADSLTKPSSPWKSIFKDVVPGLTSLAAVLISIAALVYTNHQKKMADLSAQEQRERAADAAKKKVLAALIKDFGSTAAQSSVPNADTELKLQLAAMELAAYGDQALPAVRMALGAKDTGLRHGGVLVAEQMYSAETVEHGKLTREILSYYTANSPVLRLGVLEWLAEMESQTQFSKEDSMAGFRMVKESFGSSGEKCKEQGEDLAGAAADYLSAGSFADAKDFACGMNKHCPKDFVGVHNTLKDITGCE
jgi:hypothetical protein